MTTLPRSIGLYTYSTLPRGSVVHTAHLADGLHDAGWDVTVYALDKDGRGFFRPLRARLCLVPAGPTPPSTAELVTQRARELAGYLEAHQVKHDVHHAEDCLTANALLDVRLAGRRLSVVRTVHHVEQFDDPFLSACQDRSIRKATLCLAVSENAQRAVALGFGVRAHRITNGVAAERFQEVEPARAASWRARARGDGGAGGPGPVVLAVGGVEERKNTLRLLRAFAVLRAHRPEAQLWILGGATVLDHGSYRALYERELASLPAATRAAVTELGVVAEDDVPAIFQAADVLALPSLLEGFGLAALEALAAGLPLLASNRPPFTEFLDSSCATLVEPLSEAAIAAGLLTTLDRGAIPQRREAGRRRAAEYSWRRVAALHIEHYSRLVRS